MRGAIIDLLVIMIFVTVISIVVLITYNIISGMIPGITASGMDTTGMTQAQNAVGVWDAGFIFFIIFMGVISIGSAMLIRTHPIFFVISLMILVVIIVLAPTFSNIYDAFATSVPDTNTAFPAMGFIMRDASIFFAVIGSLTAIIFYSKSRESPI